MKNRSMSLFASLCLACAFLLTGFDSHAGEKVVVRLGNSGTELHQYQVFTNKFKELVETASNGRIEIKVFPNAVLGNDREMIEGMILGQQEMFVGGSVWPWVPEAGVTDMPFLYRDSDHAYKAYDGFLLQVLGDMFREHGLNLMGYVPIGWRNISNNIRPINSADDVKGMKLRVPDSDVYIATFDALGANTVTVALSELYMALQQGVADGQDNPLSTFYAQSFQEVQKFLTRTRHIHGTAFIISNDAWFNGLPQEDRDILEKAAREAQTYQRGVLAAMEEDLLKKVIEAGVQVNEPTDIESFRSAMQDVPGKLGIVPLEWIDKIKAM